MPHADSPRTRTGQLKGLDAGVRSVEISLKPSQVKEGESRPWERRTEHSTECVHRLLSRRGSGVRIPSPAPLKMVDETFQGVTFSTCDPGGA